MIEDPAMTVEILLDSGVSPSSISDALKVVTAHVYTGPTGLAFFTNEPGSPGSLISAGGGYLTDPAEFVRDRLPALRPDLFGDDKPVEKPATPQNITAKILAMNAASQPTPLAPQSDDGSMAARLDAIRNSPWIRK